MSLKDRFTLTHQDKRLMIAAGVLVLLAMALFLSLPSLVDVKSIEAELKATVKQATGLDIEIQDGIEVTVLPTPHVKIKNLYISNIPGAATSFLLSVRTMDMKLRPTSLFSAHPTAESVTIDGVVVELERLKNGNMNWQEMAQYVASSSGSGSDSTSSPAADQQSSADKTLSSLNAIISGLSKISNLTVTNADVHFTDTLFGVISDYTDIKLKFNNDKSGNQSNLDVNVNIDSFPFKLTAQMEEVGQAYAHKTSTAKIRFSSEMSSLEYNGSIGYGENLELKGNAVFDSKNIVRWTNLLSGDDPGAAKPKSSLKPVPLTLTSEVSSEGKRVLFPSIKVGGGVFSGTLKAVLKMPLTWDIKGTLDSVDMDTIIGSGMFVSDETTSKKESEKADNAPAALNTVPKKSFWNYLSFGVDVRATNVDFNHNHIKNGHIEFDMSDGDMAISQASASFPGESKLLFTGLGKEGYQGFMIDGQLDGSGENFIEMLSLFKTAGTSLTLPVTDFKRFRFKTNMVLSAKELRFTELTSRIENMAFVGGIITMFGERTKIQTAMRMGGIDLDHFYTLWGGEKVSKRLMTEDINSTKTDDDITLWLRSIDYDLDMRASLEQYTLTGKQRDKFKFRVAATKNKITFTEMDLTYDDTQLAGKILLDVTEPLPFVDMDITADSMDVSSYFGRENFLFDSAETTNKAGGRNWSHKGIYLQWLDLLNASYHFRLGHLKSGKLEATSIDVKGGLDNRTFSASSFNATIQGAQVSGKGLIKGGKIPSVMITGDVTGLDVINLVGVMPALQGMSGKYNTHIRLSTSGIDIYTWVYNMEGNLSLTARDVTVEGFNLPGIVSAVGYVRTVADILDAVKRAFPGGSTVFSNIEGEWSVGNGIFKTPALKLRNELAEGVFSGEVDIIGWKMVGHIGFSLTYLDRVTPPKMAINYTGSLDSPEKELDTRLLEQYVANKTSEKLLHQ